MTRCRKRLITTMVRAATSMVPNRVPSRSSVGMAACLRARPEAMMGPRKLKLVPCTESRPEPRGPKRRVWMKEAMPDITRDMETM
ncbi:hypothetical protein D3C75_1191110 [compost metagenome]